MTLLLYAIADRRHVIPDGLAGLGGHAVRGVSAGELVAIVGDGPASREVTPEALLRFEEVVESLMGDGTVLPARFGTVLDDDEAVRRVLTDRHRRLASALRRVGGAVEMGVRAGWADATETSRSSGAEYLLGRLDQHQRAQRVAAELDAALADLARDHAVRIRARPEGQVTAAYLVPRPRVAEFRGACERLAAGVSEASLVCTGPWPPYSFVDSEET
jgi:Gas vesicle synthesis protein GvpL/GvpF